MTETTPAEHSLLTSRGGPYRDPTAKLQDPPRKVPRSVTVRMRFGGSLAQFGWPSVAVGLVCVFEFLRARNLGWAEGATASGTVTRAAPEKSSSDRVIWRIEYRLADDTGRTQHGRSYSDDFVRIEKAVV